MLHIAIAHEPVEHVAVAFVREQATRHAPQCVVVLVCVSQPLASIPSQLPKPMLHITSEHLPALHDAVALFREQGTPHAPQCNNDVLVSVSQPLPAIMSQFPRPALQVNPQVDAAQVGAAPITGGHAFMHVPQCETDVRVSTSHPSEAFALQSPKPVLQVNPQVPALQVVAALAAPAQVRPHIPQCVVELLRLVSQPLAAFPSQSPKPELQRNEQTPPLHSGVALAGVGHALPQRPQCAVAVRMFASQPLPAIPSQLSKPKLHVKPQVPAAHVGTALAGIGQAFPQRPQCSGELAVLTQDPLQFERDPHPLTQPLAASHTGVLPEHALPQRLQFAVVLSGSQPLLKSLSQSS
jgi:hypothetical protein